MEKLTQIKMLRTIHGGHFDCVEGRVYSVPQEQAAQWVKKGKAEYVDRPRKRTAVAEPSGETATESKAVPTGNL